MEEIKKTIEEIIQIALGECNKGNIRVTKYNAILTRCEFLQEKVSRVDTEVMRCAELEEELMVTDKLLAERQRVLDAIPECEIHGKNCAPHALEWIAKQLHKESA